MSEDALARRLAGWVDIDSTTGREPEYAAAICEHAERTGWTVVHQPVDGERANLLITRGERPAVLYSTHIDTVPPFIPARIADGRVWGRGACDTKGCVVAMFEAAERVSARHGDGACGLLLVVGEEVDHCGAIAVRDELALPGVEHIVLGEPTRNRLISHQKGLLKLGLATFGIAGHSAFPERGRSVVDTLLDILQAVRGRAWGEHRVLGPTTVNIGEIAGGVAANVFAPSAEASLMIRLSVAADPVLDGIREIATEYWHTVAPLEETGTRPDAPVLDVLTKLDPLALHVPAGEWATTTASFNSDAAWLVPHAPVTLVGPGDIEDAHSDHESVGIDELHAGVDLYEALAETFLGA